MNAPANAGTFQHRHAAHCESGVLSNLLTHHGLAISEPMVFGLSSALSFAYLPFIKIYGLPLIAYRMPPKAILNGIRKPLGVRFRFETFASPAAGEARLDALLAEGHAVGLQTSVYWLPYFPEDMRFHFNAHNLVVYGKEGDDYLISDPVAETPVRCAAADLARARFAKGLLAPKGLLYYPEPVATLHLSPAQMRPLVCQAIRKTCRIMLAPLPIVGARGMTLLAGRIARLTTAPPGDARSRQFVGHMVRMQEEIGTGGGGFRFIYAAFLQEAAEAAAMPQLTGFAEQMLVIGDEWRAFALAAARMLKNRDPFEPAGLADRLRQIAGHEADFFRALRAAVS